MDDTPDVGLTGDAVSSATQAGTGADGARNEPNLLYFIPPVTEVDIPEHMKLGAQREAVGDFLTLPDELARPSLQQVMRTRERTLLVSWWWMVMPGRHVSKLLRSDVVDRGSGGYAL